MEYVLEHMERYSILILRGSLDGQGAMTLQAGLGALADDASQPLVLDMAELSFIASMGISLLLRLARGLSERNLGTAIYRPAPMVEDILRIAGLHQLIPIEQELGKAVGRLT